MSRVAAIVACNYMVLLYENRSKDKKIKIIDLRRGDYGCLIGPVSTFSLHIGHEDFENYLGIGF